MSIAAANNLTAQRFLLQNVSWDFYEHLMRELGDRHVRVTYDRGDLEFMAPTYRHENYGRTLGRIVTAVAEVMHIAIENGGSTTFRREDLDRGLEPDDCFYVRNVRKILGKKEFDLSIDPPPDLAIEIDITHSSLDRMSIYAALGVPEVWRFDGETLEVHCLTPDGDYTIRRHSPTFPWLPMHRLVEFLQESTDVDDSTLMRKFQGWVRRQLAARKKPKSK